MMFANIVFRKLVPISTSSVCSNDNQCMYTKTSWTMRIESAQMKSADTSFSVQPAQWILVDAGKMSKASINSVMWSAMLRWWGWSNAAITSTQGGCYDLRTSISVAEHDHITQTDLGCVMDDVFIVWHIRSRLRLHIGGSAQGHVGTCGEEHSNRMGMLQVTINTTRGNTIFTLWTGSEIQTLRSRLLTRNMKDFLVLRIRECCIKLY